MKYAIERGYNVLEAPEIKDIAVIEDLTKAVEDTEFNLYYRDDDYYVTAEEAKNAIKTKVEKELGKYSKGSSSNPDSIWYALNNSDLKDNIGIETENDIHIFASYYLSLRVDPNGYSASEYIVTIEPKIQLGATALDYVWGAKFGVNAIKLGDPIDLDLPESKHMYINLALPSVFTSEDRFVYANQPEGLWSEYSLQTNTRGIDYIDISPTVSSLSSITIKDDMSYVAWIWRYDSYDPIVFESVQDALNSTLETEDEITIVLTSEATKADVSNLSLPSTNIKYVTFEFPDDSDIKSTDINFISKTINGITYTAKIDYEDDFKVRFIISASGSSGTSSGSSSNSSTSETATLEPEVKPNTDGAVNATIQAQAITDGIKDAKDSVVIAPQVDGDTEKVTVNIPKISVGDVGKAGLDLRVETPVGNVIIPADSAKKLGNVDGSRVSISVEAKEDGSTGIEIKAGNNVLDRLSSGIGVELPAAKGNVLVLVGEDGTKTVVKKSIVDGDTVRALLDGSCTVQLEDRSHDFTDVTAGKWFEDAVDFASSHDLFQGVSETEFKPDGTMTRGMLATVLWRLEGEAESAAGQVFQDIASGSWFEEGIAWASAQGIVQGYGDGTFGPDDNITREQLVTMLYRYAKLARMDTRTSGDLSSFTDQSDISSYATEAMQWAIGNQLVQGMGDGTLNPNGNATRAEVATITQRLIALMV